MEIVVKIAVTIVVSLIVAGVVKNNIPEFSMMCTVSAILFLCWLLIPEVKELAAVFERMFAKSEVAKSIMPVVKVLGITTTMKILSDMCVDAGERAIGHIAEIIGVICAIISAMPLVEQLIENVGKII